METQTDATYAMERTQVLKSFTLKLQQKSTNAYGWIREEEQRKSTKNSKI
jgi:hypothetical protein